MSWDKVLWLLQGEPRVKAIADGDTRVLADLRRELNQLFRQDLSLELVLDSLRRNMGEILGAARSHWIGTFIAHGSQLKAFLLYMPVLVPMTEIPIDTGIGSLLKLPFKVKLIFGAGGNRWGLITGMGMQFGEMRKQVWRMDFHGGHDDNSKDLTVINDLPFHYHIQRY